MSEHYCPYTACPHRPTSFVIKPTITLKQEPYTYEPSPVIELSAGEEKKFYNSVRGSRVRQGE